MKFILLFKYTFLNNFQISAFEIDDGRQSSTEQNDDDFLIDEQIQKDNELLLQLRSRTNPMHERQLKIKRRNPESNAPENSADSQQQKPQGGVRRRRSQKKQDKNAQAQGYGVTTRAAALRQQQNEAPHYTDQFDIGQKNLYSKLATVPFAARSSEYVREEAPYESEDNNQHNTLTEQEHLQRLQAAADTYGDLIYEQRPQPEVVDEAQKKVVDEAQEEVVDENMGSDYYSDSEDQDMSSEGAAGGEHAGSADGHQPGEGGDVQVKKVSRRKKAKHPATNQTSSKTEFASKKGRAAKRQTGKEEAKDQQRQQKKEDETQQKPVSTHSMTLRPRGSKK